jgi:hypothetical protein
MFKLITRTVIEIGTKKGQLSNNWELSSLVEFNENKSNLELLIQDMKRFE